MKPRLLWRNSPDRSWWAPAGVALVLVVAFATTVSGVSPQIALVNLSDSAACVAIAAIGAALVILSGGFDLSVGSVLSLVNVVLATLFTHEGQNPLLALGVGIVVGGACGLLNGLMVVVGRVPSIIATLGNSFIFGGLALFVLSKPGGEVSIDFVMLLSGTTGPVPHSLILILLAAAIWQILRMRSFGQQVYAVGADPKSAVMSGVRTSSVLLSVYLLAGAFYGLAGAFLTAQTSSGDPRIGDPLTLTVFAAVVLGGVRLGGGSGVIPAVVLGAFILSLIRDLIYVAGVSAYWFYVVTGLALVAAIALPLLWTVFRRRTRSRRLSEVAQ